ncbi:MAG: 4Fe-4S dicluster domain-containing protein [Bacillota bacterium]
MRQIMIDVHRCNGCLTCTLACASAHSLSQSIVGAMQEKTPSRIQVLSAKGKVVPLMCRHCEEPACVVACMSGAMKKDSKTGVVTNEGTGQSCVGCWMCIMACPYGAIKQHPTEKTALKCDRCSHREVPACVEACHEKALSFVEVNEYANKREKKAAASLVDEQG